MKIIHKYILDQMKMPTLFGVSLFTFVFLIDIMVQMMENVLVKGVSIIDVVRILSFYLPPILSQTIPMGFFLGVMISYSKLTSTSESTAMSAMGMSLNDMMKPTLGLAGVITVFVFFLQESIIPRSFAKLEEITYKIAYEKPAFQLREKMYIDDIDEYSIYVDDVNNEDGVAENLIIFKKESDTPFPTVVTAKRTSWAEASMILEDAEFYQSDQNGSEKLRGKFMSQKIPLNSFFEDIEIKVDEIEALSIKTLLKEMKSKEGVEKLPYEVEINKKLAIPLSTFMLGILGVLFSVGHHRTGKSVSFGVALTVIFTYIASLNVGMVMATKGAVSPIVGVWTPNLLLAGLTLYMYIKKTRRG